MLKFIEMDQKVKLSTQMDSRAGPVILINKFNVEPDDVDLFLKLWAADSAIMKRQPGFISAQLHRGMYSSTVQFRSRQNTLSRRLTILSFNPVLRDILKAPHPALISSKVAISGICVE